MSSAEHAMPIGQEYKGQIELVHPPAHNASMGQFTAKYMKVKCHELLVGKNKLKP